MFHTLQSMPSALAGGVVTHLDLWDGWAALIAAALYGFSGGSLWLPLLVAIIINPTPYGIVAGLFHERVMAPETVVVFTLVQILLAYAGFLGGRLVTRLR